MSPAVLRHPDEPATDATRLVGRRAEIAQVKELLSTARLVTLTGVAGVGKTRLARRVGTELHEAFAYGAWLVELAPLRDPTLMAHTIAIALDRPLRSPSDPIADVVDFVGDKTVLLVVDNCEHLVDACAEALNTLLRAAPELRVLATSRQPLGIAGEHIWTVPPLSTSADAGPPGSGGEPPALALFAQRARTVLPDFTITTNNRSTIIDICDSLDGIPLAIELAAAQLATLSPEQLLVGLHDRFRPSTAHRDTSDLARHTSLRGAIHWSYQLCTATEQRMWQRLSIFPGSFDLQAAEEVCAFGGTSVDDVLGLVDKSVLVRTEYLGRTRYRLPDTLAQYGQDQLGAAGEETLLRRRHRDWCLRHAQHRAAQWFGPDQAQLVTEMRTEHADVRAALEFSLATPGEENTALILAAALWFYWRGCGILAEGRYWLDQALMVNPEPSPQRAKALWANGWIAAAQGDTESATALAEQALAEAQQLGDHAALGRANHVLGASALIGEDLPRAASLLTEASQKLATELAKHSGDNDLRSAAFMSRIHLAIAQALRGESVEAAAIAEDCRLLCEHHNERWAHSYALYALALAEWRSGALTQASTHARSALHEKRSLHDLIGMGQTVELLAWIAADNNTTEDAAVLLGAAQRLWHQFGQPLFGSLDWTAFHDACETRCRRQLGDHTFETARQRGSELTTTQTIAYALAE
jgi:predicted ATPase